MQALIWVVLGVTNGVVSAIKPRSFTDRGLTVFALFFYSMPTFLLGLIFLYFLYYQLTLHGLAIFPAGGYSPLADGRRRVAEPHDPAVVHPCPGVGRDVHAADPGLDARRPR